MNKKELLALAVEEGKRGVKKKDGGPFGAVIVDKDNNIISKGHNMVLKTNDPTCHAEVVTLRKACKKLKTTNLEGCSIYVSCEPCPMCLSALMWANIKHVYFGADRKDAANIGFIDNDIYDYFLEKNNIIEKEYIEDKDCKEFLESYKGKLY